MSKESAAKTVSLLMQDNFSGRAEIGLTGDDDFHFKVSPDGTTWYEGIKITAATGAVTFPNTTIVAGRELLTANRTYYVRTDGSNSNNGLANTSGGAFLTIQKAIDTVLKLDLGGNAVTIQVGAGTYTAGASVASPFVGGLVTLTGDTTTPANVIISTTSTDAIYVANGAVLYVQGFQLKTTTTGACIKADGAGIVHINGKMDFNVCNASAGWHIFAANGAIVYLESNYTISSGADKHWLSTDGAVLQMVGARTITLTGTPAFSQFAYASRLGLMQVYSATFSGAATGARYFIDSNSIIYTAGAGATFLPGNAAGTTASGGQYS